MIKITLVIIHLSIITCISFAAGNTIGKDTTYYPPPQMEIYYSYGDDMVFISVDYPTDTAPEKLTSIYIFRNGELLDWWNPFDPFLVFVDFPPAGMNEYCAVANYGTGSSGPICEDVYVYYCEPPEMLMVEETGYFPPQTHLTWEAPPGWPYFDGWKRWDDGENHTSIGTGDTTTFDVAAMWQPHLLPQIDDIVVTEVSFFPGEEDASYAIRIWQGYNGIPETLLLDYPVADPLINEWNTVTLPQNIQVDDEQFLFIGYHIETNGGHPAGADIGPAKNHFGNMMYWHGEWTTLLELNPDLDYNWNIAVRLIAPEPENDFTGRTNFTGPGTIGMIPDYDIHYYEIYRSLGFPMEYELIDTVSPYELEYYDNDIPSPVPQLVCYKMKTFQSNGIDTCISDFSNEACLPIIPGIETNRQVSARIYPNPVKNLLKVESEVRFDSFLFLDLQGRAVMSGALHSENHSIDVSGLKAGVYVMQLWSDEKLLTRKVVIGKR